jgi:succinate dehydrogenase flavin-adding protein (antitoxin of CptAB toxin-antitoxin module)
MEKNLKYLYFKSKRRGTIELDLTLGYIADTYLGNMNKEDQYLFSQLIDVDDKTLMQWLFYNQPVPPQYDNHIWQLVKKYKKSK